MSSIDLTYEVYVEIGGIFTSTIDDLFHSEVFFMLNSEAHFKFFNELMTNECSAACVRDCLFELASGYSKSYNLRVVQTTGALEKRIRSSKIMIADFEADRYSSRDSLEKKFIESQCISSLFRHVTNGINVNMDSSLIFVYLEEFLYQNYWKFHHFRKGLHADNFIKERANDSSFVFTPLPSRQDGFSGPGPRGRICPI
jgi:hypothetical protein